MSELEREPASAEVIFGERLEKARAFTRNLAAEGELRGLIGPLELPRLWTRHILNSAVIAPLVPAGVIGDVGSGAGLPGLVGAIARPDVEWVLIEPMERRTQWLQEQADELDLVNVRVHRGRSEDWADGPILDAVTARAVSALRTLLPLTAPLVRDGGELILMKGASAEVEIEKAAKQARAYRVVDLRVESVGDGLLEVPTRVVRGRVQRS
jgi:16S rRNA (guanine527-N7)-methyltransferase